MIKRLCFLLSTLAASTLSFAQLPTGFTDELYAGTLTQPTAIAFAPDNRLFICQKGGTIRIVSNTGVLLGSTALTLPVSTNSERGLLGIAFDPDFNDNNFVYLYYTTSATSLNPPATPKNRVSRFLVDGNTVLLASETMLLDNIPSDAGNHNAGCLRFGMDGKLYISTGDGGSTPSNSQSLANLAGKILRINKDGSIPIDNPFFGIGGVRDEIYVFGLRNPFRFTFRPGTNTLYIADVGQSAWEEVNVGVAGGNYGWPTAEGTSANPAFINPAYAYPHTVDQSASITGGVFMTKGSFPAPYEGSYFFGDYVRDTIRRLTFNISNVNTGDFDFNAGSGPVDFAVGPDGGLYYSSIKTGAIRRIVYRAQLVDLGVNPSTITAGSKSTGTVTLNNPAPTGGALVGLSASAGATVPSTVTVQPGQTTANFQINTSTSSTGKSITITAVRNGIQEQATLNLTPTPNAEFVNQTVPMLMYSGFKYNVSITMANNGPTSWSDAAGYRLSSYNPVNNTTWSTNRIFLPNGVTVAPGGQHTFSRSITAPATPGNYNFQWRMLLNGYQTFGQPSQNLLIQVEKIDSEFVSQTVPTSVNAGANFNASITFRNTGTTDWTNAGGYRLASRSPADNTIWGSNRVFIPNAVTVGPNTTHTFSKTFKAPTTPGMYAFKWRMLLNGTGTFGVESPTVTITVN